ncbi:uncharacterized protein RJT21DRAFT_3147 [Scheffersomyces amazonensis]|uniref:uncharacterized protein n=1 Tax=Scheffersomyces amazonensis TaxID=1078765 RepID=UPI00315C734A
MAIHINNSQTLFSATSPISIESPPSLPRTTSSSSSSSSNSLPNTVSNYKKKRKPSTSPMSNLVSSIKSKSLKQSISIGSIKSNLHNQRLTHYKNKSPNYIHHRHHHHPLSTEQEKYLYEEQLTDDEDSTSFEDDEDDDIVTRGEEISEDLSSDEYSVISSSFSTSTNIKSTSLSKSPSVQSYLSSFSNGNTSSSIYPLATTVSTTNTTVAPSFVTTMSETIPLRHAASTESLTRLLQTQSSSKLSESIISVEEFTPILASNNVAVNETINSINENISLVSNLTQSIKKNWKILKNNPIFFIKESPRLTDDILPVESTLSLSTSSIDEEPHTCIYQELVTFNSQAHNHNTDEELFRVPGGRSFKNRDHRLNSTFLRLYAIDYNARVVTGTLVNQSSPPQQSSTSCIQDYFIGEEDLPVNLAKFHSKYDIFKISNLSRDKLWKSVVLPPRQDTSPSNCINCDDYIYVGEDQKSPMSYSLTRKSGDYLPWSNKYYNNCNRAFPQTKTLKPAGVLSNTTTVNNGLAPTAGFTKTQFTVKGWCNPRWVDTSS